MNRRQRIIVSVIGIFIVLLILIGLTYAYFLTRITGNGNPTSISVTTANLELVYGDGTTSILTSATPIEPGKFSSSKDFTVTNNGNVLTDYAVTLEDFAITYANDTVIDGQTVKAGTVTKMEYPSDMKMEITCVIESDDEERNGTACGTVNSTLPTENSILLTNSIEVDDVHKYVLTLTYLETGKDQSADMNKTIRGKIDIIDPKSTIDIEGSVATYQTGDYVEINSTPIKSEIVDSKYKIVGVEPGTHTISVKYKDANGVEQTRGSETIKLKKDEEPSVSGSTITFTDKSRVATIDIDNNYGIEINSKIKNYVIVSNISGTYIVVGDVSSEQHNLGVILTSDSITDFSSVNVTRYGSNLLNIDEMLNSSFTEVEYNTYKITAIDTDKETYSKTASLSIPANVKVTVSGNIIENTTNGEYLTIVFKFADGTSDFNFIGERNFKHEETFSKEITGIQFCARTSQTDPGQYVIYKNLRVNIVSPQLYAPYVTPQTVTANSDGTVNGLTSVSPGMTIITDSSDVEINCEYQKKTNYEYDLSDKTIVNFGDSIFGNYTYPNDISSFISNKTGATVYNVGFGGTRIASDPYRSGYDSFAMYNLATAISEEDWSVQENAIENGDWGTDGKPPRLESNFNRLKSIDFNDVDIITIAQSTNDFTGWRVIDDDSSFPYDTSTFEGALKYSIETIQSKYPNIEIVLCTPIYRCKMNSDGSFNQDSTTMTANGAKLTDFAAKIKEVANDYNLVVIDNYNDSGISYDNWSECFDGVDGIHPNEFGRSLIAENMSKVLYGNFK